MDPKTLAETEQQPNGASRRDFLKSAGKIAIYTPPAIMLLMKPGKQALACHGSLRGTRMPRGTRPPRDQRPPRRPRMPS